MAWDSQNRMASCTANGSTSTFTYGADGLRRSMTVNGVTTYYVYDGQSMVREMQGGASGSPVPTATYLTGPRGPEYRRDDAAGTVSWYVYDGLGSVVGEVDPLGNVTCTDRYDVYGAVRGRSGTASTAHGFVGSLGHLSDAATSLVYMRARYYDPNTGRFASEDPDAQGMNWFTYCGDNPANNVDANGKDETGQIGPSDIGRAIESWSEHNQALSALFGGPIGLFLLNFISKVPAALAGGANTVGMGLMMLADSMISGGKSLASEAGVDLTIYGISSNAVQGGETAALGQAMQGVVKGIGGVSELAAGMALKSVAEFMMYS